MIRRLSWCARTWVLRKFKHPLSRCDRHLTERTWNLCWGSVQKDKASCACMWHLTTYIKDCTPSVIRTIYSTDEKWFGIFQNIRNSVKKNKIKPDKGCTLNSNYEFFLLVTTEVSLPRRCSSKTSTMEAHIEKAYWMWKVEVDMKVVAAIIFKETWLCKGPLIRRKLKCSEELKMSLCIE